MEEILAFFGFSLGASLGVGVVRSVTGASQPIVRELMKAGIRARDAMASASASGSASTESEATVATPRNRGGRRRAQPEKIIIAHQ